MFASLGFCSAKHRFGALGDAYDVAQGMVKIQPRLDAAIQMRSFVTCFVEVSFRYWFFRLPRNAVA